MGWRTVLVEIGECVTVGIASGAVVSGGRKWVQAVLPLPSVRQAIVIGVPVLGLGVDVELEAVSQAVAVSIGGGHSLPHAILEGSVG